jgi:propionyl-CoA carboxylase alpha chain
VSAIRRLLVANRGEIASRVFRTCREMGIATVAVYSDADRGAPFVSEADEAVALGGRSPAESYLRIDALLAAARRTGADALHPGYGFLAESALFARACEDAGLVFVGPRAASMAALGFKLEAKSRLSRIGVPLLPWVELNEGTDLQAAGEKLGFPVIVKASAGGGGRGMRVVRSLEELQAAADACRRESAAAFGDGTVFLEPYLPDARHVEVQVFGDTRGQVVSLSERECSVQRRHQKLVEEAPSSAVHWSLRQRLGTCAVQVAQAADYVGAGTVEFLLAPEGQFYFLEMNTRLQVEHPVTEAVTGLDLVRLQILVAQGAPLPRELSGLALRGHAIEARLYAEDAAHGDRPTGGRITRLAWPTVPGIRVDAGVVEGSEVTGDYDGLLAKVIAHATTREEAAARLAAFLQAVRLHGVRTNRDLLVRILCDPEFVAGRIDTTFLDKRPDLRAPLVSRDDEALHAAAAVAAMALRRRAASPVVRFAPPAWRNNPSGPQRQTLVGEHGPREVTWSWSRSGPRVAVDGVGVPDVRLHGDKDGVLDLEADGRRQRLHVHHDGLDVDVDGPRGHSRFREVPRFSDPTSSAAAGSLLAPLPGRVARVEVAAGATVAEGALLLVLESMKMEHRVCAPAAGVLRELHVRPGDQVEAGRVLAVLDPA